MKIIAVALPMKMPKANGFARRHVCAQPCYSDCGQVVCTQPHMGTEVTSKRQLSTMTMAMTPSASDIYNGLRR
ncbi:hypothetical protein B296_00050340 [Ensete ventricosum]|uniref:Uncharacterized protein n=1 Tax=Ensete ventricosum TaxID=4639 RepID=A0A426Y7V0_ENSVE|nr:hypothetical protein B296_00050340 [Ensete ventricosum]